MRIAFMGKGGSGKTTVAAGFIRHLAASSKPLLAIDGDLNMHLAAALGMEQRQLHSEVDTIAAWLEPELSKQTPVIGTTPPTRSSEFIGVDDGDAFLQKFATWNSDRSVALLTVGTYQPDNAGTHCYHEKLQVAEMFLHRTLDRSDQWVVSDSTAGIDSVGTSLYFASDANIFVVEPTAKSVSVYAEFEKISRIHGLSTYVVANKVTDDNDRRFLESKIGAANIVGFVGASAPVRRFEQGDETAMDEFVAANDAVWKSIEALVPASERDWERYQRQLEKTFRENCEWWYDGYYQKRLADHLDPDFTYSAAVRARNEQRALR